MKGNIMRRNFTKIIKTNVSWTRAVDLQRHHVILRFELMKRSRLIKKLYRSTPVN